MRYSSNEQTWTLPDDGLYQSEIARKIMDLSIARWGRERATIFIGRDARLTETLTRSVRFAAAEGTVLITGETGTGKDLVARAMFLTATTHKRSLVSVNCAQFQNDQLAASELFGHRKGAFTGAIADHRGIFEAADHGFVFLDEVAELPLTVQAMLLRTLNTGEIVPVGATQPRSVHVRVIAATNRDLREMVARGTFREDLYYRLRHLRLHAPALRERGDDWELLARYFFDRLNRRNHVAKDFAPDTLEKLRDYPWPGNVRELASCVEAGYHIGQSSQITLEDLEGALHVSPFEPTATAAPPGSITAAQRCAQLLAGEADFWSEVHQSFIERELNRTQVRAIIANGLERVGGSYKRLVTAFGMPAGDYLKFMDFLRHHRLKPQRSATVARGRRPAPVSRRARRGHIHGSRWGDGSGQDSGDAA